MKIGDIERLSVLRPGDVDLTRAHVLARALEHRRDVVLERRREVAAQERDAQAVEAAGELGRRRVPLMTAYCSAASATVRAIAPPVSKLGA